LATGEPAEKVVLSTEDVEEKESKLTDKERLEQVLKLHETEEAAENTGMAASGMVT